MVNANDINENFWKVEQIDIEDMHFQSQGYFGLEGIVNAQSARTDSLIVTSPQNIANCSAQEIVNLHDMFLSDIIYNSIEGLIEKTSLNKLRLL